MLGEKVAWPESKLKMSLTVSNYVLGAVVQAMVLLIGRLITCGMNLLWPIKIHKYGRVQMYIYVEKVHRMQIWRERLSGLKQDGPNGQQLWSTSPKRVGWANHRRYSQIVGRLQMHKQQSDLIRIQCMEHQLIKAD